MSQKKALILLIISIFVLTVINIAMLSANSTTIRIKGKGNAIKTVDGGTTTWSCDRNNENECSITIIETS